VAHLREAPPLASSLVRGVPGVIDDILQRCLQKSPAERFQSMAELASAISIAEQSLVRSSAPDLAADPPDVPRRSAMPPPDVPGPFNAGPTTLNGASGQSLAPIALVERSRWKPVAVVILGATLAGVFGAIMFSRMGGEADGTSHVASSAPRPSEPSGATARSPAEITASTSPSASPTPAIEPNGTPPIGDPGRAIPEPPPRDPIGAATPQHQRPRPGQKHSPQPDMKGAHASSRGSAVDSKAVIKDDSQDVARGD
jgi:serine/threonine-protein kinase